MHSITASLLLSTPQWCTWTEETQYNNTFLSQVWDSSKMPWCTTFHVLMRKFTLQTKEQGVMDHYYYCNITIWNIAMQISECKSWSWEWIFNKSDRSWLKLNIFLFAYIKWNKMLLNTIHQHFLSEASTAAWKRWQAHSRNKKSLSYSASKNRLCGALKWGLW